MRPRTGALQAAVLVVAFCATLSGCAGPARTDLPEPIRDRVDFLTSVIRKAPDTQKTGEPSRYEAALELGKIGLDHRLPDETLRALKELMLDKTIHAVVFTDYSDIGGGQQCIRDGDGAGIAFLMWQLRDAGNDLDRIQLLWRQLNEPSAGDGLLEFCIDRLVEMKSDEVVPYLAAATAHCNARGSWLVRGLATRGLGEFMPLSRDILFSLTGSPYDEVSSVAQHALETGSFGPSATNKPESLESLLADLKAKEWWIRARAVRAIGARGDPQTVEPLIAALDDRDWLVRREAAAALGTAGDARAVGPLTQAMKGDWCWLVRYAALRAISVIESYSPRLGVLARAMFDADRRVRGEAVVLIGMSDEPESLDLLVRAIHDPDEGVQQVVIDALSKWTKQDKAVAALLEALDDGKDYVKSAAGKALAGIGERRAVEPLVRILKECTIPREQYRNPFLVTCVNADAAEALGQIKDPRAVDPLIEALKDAPDSVRKKAAEALGAIGDPRAVAALCEAAEKDEDGRVRQAAKESLEKIRGVGEK